MCLGNSLLWEQEQNETPECFGQEPGNRLRGSWVGKPPSLPGLDDEGRNAQLGPGFDVRRGRGGGGLTLDHVIIEHEAAAAVRGPWGGVRRQGPASGGDSIGALALLVAQVVPNGLGVDLRVRQGLGLGAEVQGLPGPTLPRPGPVVAGVAAELALDKRAVRASDPAPVVGGGRLTVAADPGSARLQQRGVGHDAIRSPAAGNQMQPGRGLTWGMKPPPRSRQR